MTAHIPCLLIAILPTCFPHANGVKTPGTPVRPLALREVATDPSGVPATSLLIFPPEVAAAWQIFRIPRGCGSAIG